MMCAYTYIYIYMYIMYIVLHIHICMITVHVYGTVLYDHIVYGMTCDQETRRCNVTQCCVMIKWLITDTAI